MSAEDMGWCAKRKEDGDEVPKSRACAGTSVRVCMSHRGFKRAVRKRAGALRADGASQPGRPR